VAHCFTAGTHVGHVESGRGRSRRRESAGARQKGSRDAAMSSGRVFIARPDAMVPPDTPPFSMVYVTSASTETAAPYVRRAASTANNAPRSDGIESSPHMGTTREPDALAAASYFARMESTHAVSPVMSA
jgi:hypothetical protein